MLTYCSKCKKGPESLYSKMLKTENGRPFLSSKYAVCGSKKSRFVKEKKAKGLLSSIK